MKDKKLIKKDELEKVNSGVKQGLNSQDLLRESNSSLVSKKRKIIRKPDGPELNQFN